MKNHSMIGLLLFVASTPASATTAMVYWNQTHQTMEGFGSMAGRSGPFMADPARDAILSALVGDQGLRLSMLRMEILPENSPASGVFDFQPTVDMAPLAPSDECYGVTENDNAHCDQRGLSWVVNAAHQTHGVNRFIATAWTPPLYMKNLPDPTAVGGLNGLNPAYSAAYADYLARFVQAYRQAGIPITAISPLNEPENIFASWSSAVWDPITLGAFAYQHLKPTLQAYGFDDVRVMAAENANWSVTTNVFMTLPALGCAVLNLLAPDCGIDLLASHGYSLPDLVEQSVTFDTAPAGPSVPGILLNKPRWITEAGGSGNDPGMDNGIKLAVSLHEFLANQHVSAYFFWLGMVRGQSNEALINSSGDGNYVLGKAYDVFGQFTRHIHPGDVNIQVDNLDGGVRVSAFRNPQSKDFTIVAVNSDSSDQPLSLSLKGFNATQVVPVETPPALGVRWQTRDPIPVSASGTIATTVPAMSVVTYIGTAL